MKAGSLTLAAVALTAAVPAHAQNDQPFVPPARIAITPFIGARAPLISDRAATVILPGLVPLAVRFQERQTGGGIGGAEVDIGLIGPVGIAGAFLFSNPDDIVLTTESQGAITRLDVDGPSVLFARVALSWRLPEPDPASRRFHPAAFLTIGPAVVREDYGDGLLSLGGGDTVDNWALAIGAKGVQTIGSRNLAIQFGVEDFVTFWNPNDDELRRIERFLQLQPRTLLGGDFDYDNTHIWVFHVGLSLRL